MCLSFRRRLEECPARRHISDLECLLTICLSLRRTLEGCPARRHSRGLEPPHSPPPPPPPPPQRPGSRIVTSLSHSCATNFGQHWEKVPVMDPHIVYIQVLGFGTVQNRLPQQGPAVRSALQPLKVLHDSHGPVGQSSATSRACRKIKISVYVL